jgi:hypothetical protein
VLPDFRFSALKKSGSIEAGKSARDAPSVHRVFRFEKKRLH